MAMLSGAGRSSSFGVAGAPKGWMFIWDPKVKNPG
jgi:hypothetical protein